MSAKEQANTTLAPGAHIDQLAELFAILADPTRLRILRALSTSELCVCEIGEVLNELTQSAVSHQLRLLRAARLVKTRREGRRIFYSLDDHHVETLLAQALDHISE